MKEYEWLVYSGSQAGGYCKHCVLFAKLKKGVLGTLAKAPFRNFSKLKGKDGYRDVHNSSVYHHEAMLKGKAFIQVLQKPKGGIDSLLQGARRTISNQNKHMSTVIVDTMKLCGMQGIPSCRNI